MAEIIVDKLQGGHYAFLEELPYRTSLNNFVEGTKEYEVHFKEGY